ncbi:TPA: hypothetical protein CPT90_04495 [Candidatus Gastranaerophilales bacterium HUM_3]|nr:glycosyltransferase [Acinetobacter sp.]DAA84657.1 MAG TPA: hypothetical protein CPT90_04495 [Candidatus Gastranaerophilales bacterium HUM_3]DAB13091.1 MAG TPA: hypothetical protein CPT91_01320 [Candidatus Gastranaerophilales bacterium HUM_16]
MIIPIFLSSDNNYAPYIATTIASICDNTAAFCEFYILDGGIKTDNKTKIKTLMEQYNNFSIEYINIDTEKYFKNFVTNSYITLPTYYRFIIPQLKLNLERILYLDVDIIVKGDIQELFNTNLDNKVLGAIKDLGDSYYIKRLKFNVEIDPSHTYFNAGVLLIDCKKWREQNISEKLFNTEKKYRGKLLCNDQDVLNKVFENNYKMLLEKFNALTLKGDTVIRHYYSKPKPWEIKQDIKNSSQLLQDVDLFWYYAQKTPYYEQLCANCQYKSPAQIQLLMLYKKKFSAMGKKVSVIIPVYNAAQYLERCLDSVINQTLKDIEIICINDCSTDNSLEILEEYASKDNRIKIIDFKENKGVAAARNAGINEAQGEYIGFVDPDDYIDSDFYAQLYKKAYETKADIVKGNDINVVYCDGTKKMLPQNESIKEHKINFWVQFTTAIFKKDFLIKNNIEFPEEMNVCEDIVFVTKSAILTNLIEIVPNANYYYIRRDDSLDSNQYNSQKIDSVINYVRTITNFIKEYDISLNDKQILLGRIVAQLDQIRKYKIEQNSEEYKILTKLYQQKVIEKMRLK